MSANWYVVEDDDGNVGVMSITWNVDIPVADMISQHGYSILGPVHELVAKDTMAEAQEK